ncbi:ABC transporter ATP-binding protein [Celeribacter naphthalenivorans]|uniref:ABC transporter ATP-binding protein n=1 Tax=Celeribacter naphthalenivorans TaxID=1614694 RepID=UPI001CF9E2E1|nr:ABC transporter ATP-binding protein [Celeribacter naphthalenivorans]
MELIRTTGLAIGAAQKTVARGIDITLCRSEILGVLGPNGAGKTTLFRTILGLAPAHDGDILLGGTPMAQLTRRKIAHRIAYVPQSMSAPFPDKVSDYVLAGRTAHLGPFAAPGAADRTRAASALAALGITALADAPINRISGGERQAAMIARAVAQDAPALMLDEPDAALDFGKREHLAQLLQGLATQGYGLIFTSHDPFFIERVADRVLTIDRQGHCRSGRADEMITDAQLSALYGIAEHDVRQARRGRRAETGIGRMSRMDASA